MSELNEGQEEVDANAFRLELPMFEGPLDLLLHLIQSHELDILDLPIAFVTEKYLGYLALFEDLNLDLASEYLVMAATLAHIKSKMLLPPSEDEGDDDEDEIEQDPREELVRRLLEYQKYKAASEELASRGLQGRDVFLRGSPAPKAEGPAPLGNMTLFSLMDAFQRVLKRANADFSREITSERITIQERMAELVELLGSRDRVEFVELFEGHATKYDYVVTFLAILEMAKTRLVRIYQNDSYSPIYLTGTVLDEPGTKGEQTSEAEGDAGGVEAAAAGGDAEGEQPAAETDAVDTAAEEDTTEP